MLELPIFKNPDLPPTSTKPSLCWQSSNIGAIGAIHESADIVHTVWVHESVT